jgi:MFS family permease
MRRLTKNHASSDDYESSLTFTLFDAIFIAVIMGVGEYYFGAYAIALGATSFQMGFFGSLPLFLGSVLQVISPKLTETLGSRKRAVLLPSIVKSFIWAGIIACSQLLPTYRIWVLIGLVSLYYIVGYISLSPWTSWIGDLLDETKRAGYFSTRSRLSTIVSLISVVGAGLFLEFSKAGSAITPFSSFIIVFGIATLSSVCVSGSLALTKDIPPDETKRRQSTLSDFTKRLFKDTFGRFTVFNMFFYTGLYIAIPFYIVYQLKILDFTYTQLMIGFAATFMGKFLFYRVWSSLTAIYHSAWVLSVSIFIIAIGPLLWVLFANSPLSVYILNLIGGMGWSGFELLSYTFLFDSVQPKNRTRYSSFLTFFRGWAILIGGSLGAFIIHLLSASGEAYMWLFGIASAIQILGFVCFLYLIDGLKEMSPISFQRIVLDVFTRIPRQGTRAAFIGFRTTQRHFKRITDKSTAFLEESEDDED